MATELQNNASSGQTGCQHLARCHNDNLTPSNRMRLAPVVKPAQVHPTQALINMKLFKQRGKMSPNNPQKLKMEASRSRCCSPRCCPVSTSCTDLRPKTYIAGPTTGVEVVGTLTKLLELSSGPIRNVHLAAVANSFEHESSKLDACSNAPTTSFWKSFLGTNRTTFKW